MNGVRHCVPCANDTAYAFSLAWLLAMPEFAGLPAQSNVKLFKMGGVWAVCYG